MKGRYLDMQSYQRKEHFEYFCSLAYPYVGVTVNADITDLLHKIQSEGLPFFLTICYCAAKAANRIPEFRQRIADGRIVEFERCKTSHTVALADGTYCYCTLENHMPFPEYISYAAEEQQRAKEMGTIEEAEEETMDLFFVSSLPWVSYTSMIQPVPVPADSNPRITWGKYFSQSDRVFLPVSTLCNHALVDGRHLADFYRLFEEELAGLCR